LGVLDHHDSLVGEKGRWRVNGKGLAGCVCGDVVPLVSVIDVGKPVEIGGGDSARSRRGVWCGRKPGGDPGAHSNGRGRGTDDGGNCGGDPLKSLADKG